MSHMHFDEYDIKEPDLIFLPPEVLRSCPTASQANAKRKPSHLFQLNNSMDVWTLGMILLHCLCLEYRRSEGESEADKSVDTVEEILSMYLKVKGPSLINLEEDPAEAAAAIAEAE